MQRLQNQTAIVTGGSSGIGRGAVKMLAAEGANVVINFHTDEDDAMLLVREIETDGGHAIAVKANVSREKDVDWLFQKAIEQFGNIDILVANSGIQQDTPFIDLTLDQWNRVIDVNLTGQFLCAQRAVRRFILQDILEGVSCAAGKIVCMSSVHEVIPWAGHVNYATSKGGVHIMMQCIAQEVAHRKIRVNSIAPGAIQTPINQPAWVTDEARAELLKLIPSGRIGQPEDIAKAVVWLASDESDYINGTTSFVDGGMTLYPGFTERG